MNSSFTPESNKMMREELERIKGEVLDSKNPYQLTEDEQKNFKVVINTIIYLSIELGKDEQGSQFIQKLMDNTLDKDGNYKSEYVGTGNGEDYTGLHLSNYKGFSKELRKGILFTSLVETFVKCFNLVKAASADDKKNHVKEFAGQLGGVCVDARTRMAFDNAFKLGNAPIFQKILSELGYSSYFQSFYFLLTRKWGQAYSKESESQLVMKNKDGVINSDRLEDIADYLSSDEAGFLYEPDEDFLENYENIPDDLKPIFFKFLLLPRHREFLNNLELKTEEEKEKFNQCMMIAMISEGDIPGLGEYIRKNKIPVQMLFTIIQDKLPFVIFKKLSDKNKKALLTLLNVQCLSPDLLKELQTFYMNKSDPEHTGFLDKLIKNDEVEMVKFLMNINILGFDDNFILVKAIKYLSKDILLFFVKENKASYSAILQKSQNQAEKEIMAKKLLSSIVSGKCDENEIQAVVDILKLVPNLINAPMDTKGNTILHLAAYYDHDRLIDVLIDETNVFFDALNSKKISPIKYASSVNSWKSFETLYNRDKIKKSLTKDDHSLFLLRAAVANQSKIAISMADGVKDDDLNARGQMGPIHYAIIHNDTHLASVILEKCEKISINSVFNNGSTPWIFAAQNKEVTVETLQWLLQQNKLDILYKFNQKTAFQIALELKHPAFNSLLKENNIPLIDFIINNKLDNDKIVSIAVDIYKYGDNENLINFITNLKSEINNPDLYTQCIDKISYCMFYLILEKNDTKMLEFILQQAPNCLKATDSSNDKNSLLHIAGKHNKPDIIKILLSRGAKITDQNAQGRTPIWIAADNKAWDAIDVMTVEKTDANDEAQYCIALVSAVKENKEELALRLLALDTPTRATIGKKSSFYYAILNNNIILFDALCSKKQEEMEKLNKDNLGLEIFEALSLDTVSANTMRHILKDRLVSDDLMVELIEKLIKNNQYHKLASFVLMTKNDHYISAIISEKLDDFNFIANFIKEISILNAEKFNQIFEGINESLIAQDKKENFSLTLLKVFSNELLKPENERLNEVFFKHYPNYANLPCDDNGNTLLHLSIKYKNPDAFHALLKRGADIRVKNKSSQSVLYTATLEGEWDIVDELLVNKGLDPVDLECIIYYASKVPDTSNQYTQAKKIIETLIDRNVAVYRYGATDKMGMTALHYAVQNGDIELCERLINGRLGNPNLRANNNTPTPLIMAFQAGSITPQNSIIFLLKQKGIDLSCKFNNKTALQFLIENKSPEKIYDIFFNSSKMKPEIIADIINTQIKNGDSKSAAIMLMEMFKLKIDVLAVIQKIIFTQSDDSVIQFCNLVKKLSGSPGSISTMDQKELETVILNKEITSDMMQFMINKCGNIPIDRVQPMIDKLLNSDQYDKIFILYRNDIKKIMGLFNHYKDIPLSPIREGFIKEIHKQIVQNNYDGLVELINSKDYPSATLILSELYNNEKTLVPLLDNLKSRIDSQKYISFLNDFAKNIPNQSKLFNDHNNMFFYLIMSGVNKAIIEDILKNKDLGLSADQMKANKDRIELYDILRRLSVDMNLINANDIKFLKRHPFIYYEPILDAALKRPGNDKFNLDEAKKRMKDLSTIAESKDKQTITLSDLKQTHEETMKRYDTLFSLFKKTNNVNKLKKIRQSALAALESELKKTPEQKENLKVQAMTKPVFNEPYYKGGWTRWNIFKIMQTKLIKRDQSKPIEPHHRAHTTKTIKKIRGM